MARIWRLVLSDIGQLNVPTTVLSAKQRAPFRGALFLRLLAGGKNLVNAFAVLGEVEAFDFLVLRDA